MDYIIFSLAQVVGWPLTKSGRAEGQCLMVLQFLRQLHLKGKVSEAVAARRWGTAGRYPCFFLLCGNLAAIITSKLLQILMGIPWSQ